MSKNNMSCCRNRLKHAAERLRRLIHRDEKRLQRRRRQLEELAIEIRNPQHLPTLCSDCDDGE